MDKIRLFMGLGFGLGSHHRFHVVFGWLMYHYPALEFERHFIEKWRIWGRTARVETIGGSSSTFRGLQKSQPTPSLVVWAPLAARSKIRPGVPCRLPWEIA